MAEHSTIEWTDATWNVVTGCSVISPGCTNCYAMKLAGTRLKNHPSRAGLTVDTKAGPVWTGGVRFNEAWLRQPLQWKRPRRIFVAAHGDLFHESMSDDVLDQVFAVMALASQHAFQVLTKRADRMRRYLTTIPQPRWIDAMRKIAPPPAGKGILLQTTNGSLPNVWLGVSVEDQARADERIPDLLCTPAAVRWISAEPLIGPIDLDCPDVDWAQFPAGNGLNPLPPDGDGRLLIDWVVVGGESGPNARPMHPDWARSLRDQCVDAGVPFVFKQWGAWSPAGPAYPDEVEATDEQRAAWEQAVMEAPETGSGDVCCMSRDGELPIDYRYPGEYQPRPGSGAWWLERVGKKAAGRELDGRTWDELPTTPSDTPSRGQTGRACAAPGPGFSAPGPGAEPTSTERPA